MNWKRLKLMRKAARVLRMHTMPTQNPQSVGEHTFGLMCILMEITDDPEVMPRIDRGMLLEVALHHDAQEALTGDCPAPTKWRHMELQGALDMVEERINKEFELTGKSVLSKFEQGLLKYADLMELAMFSIEEIETGDTRMAVVARNCINALIKRELTDITPEALRLFDLVRLRLEQFPSNLGEDNFNGWKLYED